MICKPVNYQELTLNALNFCPAEQCHGQNPQWKMHFQHLTGPLFLLLFSIAGFLRDISSGCLLFISQFKQQPASVNTTGKISLYVFPLIRISLFLLCVPSWTAPQFLARFFTHTSYSFPKSKAPFSRGKHQPKKRKEMSLDSADSSAFFWVEIKFVWKKLVKIAWWLFLTLSVSGSRLSLNSPQRLCLS